MSNHIAAGKGEIAKTVLLPGDPLRAKFIAETFLEDVKCYNEIRGMYGFTGKYKGAEVSVQGTGMGMPSMGIYSWELMESYDVQNLIRVGTAGGYGEDVKLRDVIFAMSASMNSNYTDAFKLPGRLSPTASFKLLNEAVKAAEGLGIPFKAGSVLSEDTFYNPYGEPEKWAKMGVLAAEMECAALYSNAAFHGRDALCILTVSNHIIRGEETTAEEREKSFTDMMRIALEVALKLQ